MMYISKFIIFQAGFASQGVLNKDPTVWLDEAGPANTCIPPPSQGTHLKSYVRIPTPKSIFASI
jgi:hypothetical protein